MSMPLARPWCQGFPQHMCLHDSSQTSKALVNFRLMKDLECLRVVCDRMASGRNGLLSGSGSEEPNEAPSTPL